MTMAERKLNIKLIKDTQYEIDGVSFVGISKNIDCVITAPHCIIMR